MSYFRKKLIKESLILCLLILPCITSAQGTGTVEGTISRNGAPLSNTEVVLMSEVLASYEATVYSDNLGFFSFTGVPLGNIEAIVLDNNGVKSGSQRGVAVLQGTVLDIFLQ